MKKLSNTEAWKNIVAYKKKDVIEIIEIYLQIALNNWARTQVVSKKLILPNHLNLFKVIT